MADCEIDFTEFQKLHENLIHAVMKDYPDETKKFLKTEAKKLNKVTKQTARNRVKKKTGNYLKGFKTGKVYKYGGNEYADTCIRVYNNAPHAHLIEYGHKMTDKKGNKTGDFVQGKHVLEVAGEQFNSEFEQDCIEFIEDFMDLIL